MNVVIVVKISVAITTFNGEKYIREQLQSILNQTIIPDEIIIVDDCSTDGTLHILKSFSDANFGLFQIYFNDYNIGYKKNFKKAISLCTGDYIFLCDQDDYWNPDKIERMITIMQNTQCSVLSSSFSLIDKNSEKITIKQKRGFSNQNFYKRKIKPNDLVKVPIDDLFFHNICQGCSMLINREIAKQFCDYFSNKIPHDWQINILGALSDSVYFYNSELFHYRLHSDNTIGYGVSSNSFSAQFNVNIRLQTVRDFSKIYEFIMSVSPKFIEDNNAIQKCKIFAEKHIENITKKELLHLFIQNLDPCYSKAKSYKGRLIDLLFVLNKKGYKG